MFPSLLESYFIYMYIRLYKLVKEIECMLALPWCIYNGKFNYLMFTFSVYSNNNFKIRKVLFVNLQKYKCQPLFHYQKCLTPTLQCIRNERAVLKWDWKKWISLIRKCFPFVVVALDCLLFYYVWTLVLQRSIKLSRSQCPMRRSDVFQRKSSPGIYT